MALLTTHNIGSNDEGLDGASAYGDPIDNGDFYTFDGEADGLYWDSDWGDETAIDIYALFRLHDLDHGETQTIWKSGGYINGIALGLDSEGNLGLFGCKDKAVTAILVDKADLIVDTWLEVRASKSKVQIVNNETGYIIAEAEGSCSPGDGNSAESIGFSRAQSPITAINATRDFFCGDIDIVEIWDEDTLSFVERYYEVSGTVEEEGSPAERIVRIYKRSTGELVAETTSVYGEFMFDELWEQEEHYVVALDDTSGETDYNALIYDRIIPQEIT